MQTKTHAAVHDWSQWSQAGCRSARSTARATGGAAVGITSRPASSSSTTRAASSKQYHASGKQHRYQPCGKQQYRSSGKCEATTGARRVLQESAAGSAALVEILRGQLLVLLSHLFLRRL